MSLPVVSIILPTFNGSQYIEEAVSSCRFQTFSDWELIIVDDASTDQTPELLARLRTEDSRIRTFRHETNRKLPAALNTGFSIASGRYLTWTSDDNCFRSHALAEMVAFLEGHPETGMVFTAYSVIDEYGNEIGRRSPGDPTRLHLLNCIGPSFLYRREVYEQVGLYSESLFLVEDYDYWLRAAARFILQPLDKDLYFFREHTGSLTHLRQKQISLALEKLLVVRFPLFRNREYKVTFDLVLRIASHRL